MLYGLGRDDVGYILSTFSGAGDRGQTMFSTGGAFARILEHYDRLDGA
jgi:hypothetical protein